MVVYATDSVRCGWLATWRVKFGQILPEIELRARNSFQGAGPRRREELVAEAVENAFGVYILLAECGKADIVYPKPLAISAVKQVRAALARGGSIRGRRQPPRRVNRSTTVGEGRAPARSQNLQDLLGTVIGKESHEPAARPHRFVGTIGVAVRSDF